MPARILHQLRGAVKTHGLAIEQGAQKGGRFVAFQPGTGVGQQGETGRVRLGKAVFAEALDLAEDGLCELPVILIFDHRFDDAFLVIVHAALAFPGRHGAPQLIGLAGREIGRDDGHLHHLFLEDGNTQGASQRLVQALRILDRFFLLAPLQIRMHHAALDGTGTHQRHFDDEVVELARAQPGQHAHLRARLDLEHADGVGLAHHVVGGGVFAGNVLHAELFAAPRTDQFQGAAQGRQHPQRQHVHLHQAQLFQVILVPLDDAAPGHAGVFDGHQARQFSLGDDEAARMLRQVAGKAQQLLRQRSPLLRQFRFRVQPAFGQAVQQIVLAVEPAVRLGHFFHDGQVHAQRPAAVAQGALRPVADHHGRQRGPLAPIFAVDILDDLFAPLVLEIDVDVGRLVALARHEAPHQAIAARRVHFRDVQAIADGRIGGRPPALAQDVLRPCKAHDVVDGQEVGFI
eukprot:gene22391-biopygen18867